MQHVILQLPTYLSASCAISLCFFLILSLFYPSNPHLMEQLSCTLVCISLQYSFSHLLTSLHTMCSFLPIYPCIPQFLHLPSIILVSLLLETLLSPEKERTSNKLILQLMPNLKPSPLQSSTLQIFLPFTWLFYPSQTLPLSFLKCTCVGARVAWISNENESHKLYGGNSLLRCSSYLPHSAIFYLIWQWKLMLCYIYIHLYVFLFLFLD